MVGRTFAATVSWFIDWWSKAVVEFLESKQLPGIEALG